MLFLRKVKLCTMYAFIPGLHTADIIEKQTDTEKNADLLNVKEESGWDRIKRMFATDEFGSLTAEVISILQVGWFSMFVGGVYGGIIQSRNAYMDFMRTNQATSFRSHLDAKRQLQDQVTIGFGKGAFKWGWRLSLFCTIYTTVSTTVSVYRNKSGILEHLIAGATAGSLYKFQMGPRGWIVGGGLGLVLGAIGGSCTLALLKLTGMSMEEIRYWQYKWKEARETPFYKELNRHLEKETYDILAERDRMLKESSQLDTLETLESKKSEK